MGPSTLHACALYRVVFSKTISLLLGWLEEFLNHHREAGGAVMLHDMVPFAVQRFEPDAFVL